MKWKRKAKGRLSNMERRLVPSAKSRLGKGEFTADQFFQQFYLKVKRTFNLCQSLLARITQDRKLAFRTVMDSVQRGKLSLRKSFLGQDA